MPDTTSLESSITYLVLAVFFVCYAALAAGSWTLRRKLGSRASRVFFGSVVALPVLYLLLMLARTLVDHAIRDSLRGTPQHGYDLYIVFGSYCIWLMVCALSFYATVRAMPALSGQDSR